MLLWYWLAGLVSAPIWLLFGHWWCDGLFIGTFYYFVQTLAQAIEQVNKYKTLKLYVVYDITIFLVTFLPVCVYNWWFYGRAPGTPGTGDTETLILSLMLFAVAYTIAVKIVQRRAHVQIGSSQTPALPPHTEHPSKTSDAQFR
jgi:hypothetical protein